MMEPPEAVMRDRHTSPPRRHVGIVLALLLGFVGCHECGHDQIGGGGDLVGGPCFDSRDCADRCVHGGDFPDGTCTVDCAHDGHCPDGTVCIHREGGICLLPCGHDGDCRPGYDCKNTDREGAPGDAAVCIH
jgi:hypothetical protein